jgi:hypothetical protein
MPGYNRTGPRGTGMLTGRGRGGCHMHQEMQGAELRTPDAAGAILPGEPDAATGETRQPFYGAGRGGIPCGCGHGHVHAGGRRCCQ